VGHFNLKSITSKWLQNYLIQTLKNRLF